MITNTQSDGKFPFAPSTIKTVVVEIVAQTAKKIGIINKAGRIKRFVFWLANETPHFFYVI